MCNERTIFKEKLAFGALACLTNYYLDIRILSLLVYSNRRVQSDIRLNLMLENEPTPLEKGTKAKEKEDECQHRMDLLDWLS